MCVHTRHCQYYSCKYGKEEICPVWLGLAEPECPDGSVKPTNEQFAHRNEEADCYFECFDDSY